eukprot:scaffold36628_cov20-Tisochrysis_lutea.AAC.1
MTLASDQGQKRQAVPGVRNMGLSCWCSCVVCSLCCAHDVGFRPEMEGQKCGLQAKNGRSEVWASGRNWDQQYHGTSLAFF